PTSGNSEAFGYIVAVMYNADGTVITRNSQSASDRVYIDFNLDRLQRYRNNAANVTDYTCMGTSAANYPAGTTFPFQQKFEDDEPFISPVPYLAVYDDDKARETRTTNW